VFCSFLISPTRVNYSVFPPFSPRPFFFDLLLLPGPLCPSGSYFQAYACPTFFYFCDPPRPPTTSMAPFANSSWVTRLWITLYTRHMPPPDLPLVHCFCGVSGSQVPPSFFLPWQPQTREGFGFAPPPHFRLSAFFHPILVLLDLPPFP